jgi:signal peptidase II
VRVQVLIVAIVLLWLGADQALKFWTVANITYPTVHPYQPFPAFISLAHVVNTGAAWSLFSSATPVLIGIRLIVGAAIFVWLLRKPRPKLETIAFSFIVAGAWGNAIDGILYGHVVDMLQSHWLTAVYRIFFPGQIFPIFNLADCGVVGGVLLLLYLSLTAPRKPAPLEEAANVLVLGKDLDKIDSESKDETALETAQVEPNPENPRSEINPENPRSEINPENPRPNNI